MRPPAVIPLWFLLLCWAAAFAGMLQAQVQPSVVSVADARASMARREFTDPARVQGVVTFTNSRLGLAYLQDASGGIGFDPRIAGDRAIQAGDHLELTGYLGRRQGLAMILRDRAQWGPAKVRFLEEPASKLTVRRFELADAAQLRIDGLQAKLTGIVRRISVPPVADAPMVVEVSSASGYAIARLPWREPQAVLDSWLNKPVSMSAVLICRADPPLLPADADALLLVPSRQSWTIDQRGLLDVFQRQPLLRLGDIQVTPRGSIRQRVHVSGIVTAAKPRAWVCLRTEDGSLEIRTRQMQQFLPGQKLAVAGWPKNEEGRLLLEDGVCRFLERGPPPPPMPLEGGFFNDRMQHELVQVQGRVQSQPLPGEAPRLVLELDNGVRCRLLWEEFIEPAQLSFIRDGSRISAAGICLIENSQESWQQGQPHITLMPRGLADIAILKSPPWWTPSRLRRAVWMLLGLVLCTVSGAFLFRWQLWRQARRIREFESRAAAEEERLRIAREFHDSLQQQLTGAALHLETLKGALHAAPDMLPRLIDDTAAMLRHCQAEARQCIWDLRNDSPAPKQLGPALRQWLQQHQGSLKPPHLEFDDETQGLELDEPTCFQLLRIAQEAVTNALKHARAGRITVRLRRTAEQAVLVVEDDGCGFASALINRPEPGHFGLSGMRERAAKIGARLHIHTQPGGGTRLSVQLTLSSSTRHESLV